MANPALSDKTYDLMSVIYHASQALETANTYRADAESAGDTEAVAFFRQVEQDNRRLAERGAELLKARLQ